MKNKKLVLMLSTFLFSIQIFGQKITLQEATEMALRNNKSIKIQMLEVERSKINVDKAWKNAYFNVSYSASAGRYFKDIGGTDESYTHSVTLTQPLYVGGTIKSGIKIGKKSLELAELNMNKTRKDTILSTVQAYINVYDAQNTLDVYKISKQALDRNYEIQKEKYNLRMVTRPELLESERSVKAMEANILTQEAAVEINKETLGNIIGIDGSTIEIVPFGVNEKFTTMVNLKDDLERLKTENTEYLMALKNVDISKENINIEKAKLRPSVNGIVNYGTLSPVGKVSELRKGKNYNGSIGVNFSWTLFDWGARRLDVKYAEKGHEISGIQATQTLDDLKINMKNVYYQIQALEKSLEALQTAVKTAEESYELEVERYENRLITLNDLLTAESNLRQARTNYLSSRLNYYYLVSQYGSLLD